MGMKMITTEIIETEKGAALGIKINLDYRPPPLIVIQAEHGYLACGYISSETVEKTEDCMALIKGVDSYDSMLKGTVAWASKRAKIKGVKAGMKGLDALNKLIE